MIIYILFLEKGILILFGFILFVIGSILDTAISLTPFTLPITRIIVIVGAIIFYLGFMSPIEEAQEKSIQETYDASEFLRMVAKRKKNPLTEKEIIFYKERKICLVCKTKPLRFTYICPDCDAIYCMTCVNALSDLENACWVCKSPFDPTKPVRSIEFEGEDLIVETEEPAKNR